MLRLLSPLIGGFASGSIKGVVRRTKIQVLCLAVVAVGMFFTLCCACIIGYLGLRAMTSPLISATVLFGFWLLVAAGALITMKILSARHKQHQKQEMAQERARLLMNTALAAIPAALTVNRKFALATALPLIGIALFAFLSDPEKPHGDDH